VVECDKVVELVETMLKMQGHVAHQATAVAWCGVD
jgi:hypothetical protein